MTEYMQPQICKNMVLRLGEEELKGWEMCLTHKDRRTMYLSVVGMRLLARVQESSRSTSMARQAAGVFISVFAALDNLICAPADVT